MWIGARGPIGAHVAADLEVRSWHFSDIQAAQFKVRFRALFKAAALAREWDLNQPARRLKSLFRAPSLLGTSKGPAGSPRNQWSRCLSQPDTLRRRQVALERRA